MFFSYTIYIITDIYKIIHKKPGKQVSELFASGNSSQPYLTMRLVAAAVAVTAAAATAEDQDENQNPPVIVTVHK